MKKSKNEQTYIGYLEMLKRMGRKLDKKASASEIRYRSGRIKTTEDILKLAKAQAKRDRRAKRGW